MVQRWRWREGDSGMTRPTLCQMHRQVVLLFRQGLDVVEHDENSCLKDRRMQVYDDEFVLRNGREAQRRSEARPTAADC